MCCPPLQSYNGYGDMFSETWQAFSRHPLQRLSDYEGKRVSAGGGHDGRGMGRSLGQGEV